MLYKRFRKEKKRGTFLPILIPVMNLFLLILPFVIQNAFLQKIASMEMQLPSISEVKGTSVDVDKDVTIEIGRGGLGLFVGGVKTLETDLTKGFEDRLYQKLIEIKKELPKKQDILLKVDPLIEYEKVVKVIDVCKSEGKLFPNVVYFDEVR